MENWSEFEEIGKRVTAARLVANKELPSHEPQKRDELVAEGALDLAACVRAAAKQGLLAGSTDTDCTAMSAATTPAAEKEARRLSPAAIAMSGKAPASASRICFAENSVSFR